MEQISYYVTAIAFFGVIVCWFVFAGTFLLRKKPEASPDAVKAPKSFWGIALQGVGFGLVWALHRTPLFSPFVPSEAVNIVMQIFALILSVSSVALSRSAVRELGKQWSFQARLVEDHRLITSGVYGLVRHPIYTAMLGNLIATGIVLSHWAVVLVAVVIFLIGTTIRTRLEERLLAGAFGSEFESWKAKVPGLIPGLRH
ncbi:MAG: isoprenylcysteine carboxylmethyltransferase family protein [Acidobacteriota bacterium]